MVLLLDAGALYAQADRHDPHHAAVAEILRAERGPLIASAIGVAEADYLILTRLGIDVELAFLEDLAEGTFQLECLTRIELATALATSLVAIVISRLALPTPRWSSWPIAFTRDAWSPLMNEPSATSPPCRAAHSLSCPPTGDPFSR